MLRWLTAGESHGPALVAMLEGLPANVGITGQDISDALARRRLGYGRGARMSFEADELEIVSGIRHGKTLGSPIALRIGNSEWPKWQRVMSADPVDPDELAGLARNAPLTRPRPGHADLVGMQKYGFDEARPILERASARETASRVALGAIARAFLRQVASTDVLSHVVELGTAQSTSQALPTAADVEALDADPVRCFDAQASAKMVEEIDVAHKDGDTLGGVVEVVVRGLPPGLGSHIQWDRRLDSRLAAALMGIQAIKGVEIGDGFDLARSRGSAAHDQMHSVTGTDDTGDSNNTGVQPGSSADTTAADAPVTSGGLTVQRQSGRSGGTEGGMSTGDVLRVRAAMKPISTVPRALQTVDVASGEPARAHHQRSDVCAVPAAGIVAEAMVALVLADAVIEKFGGDSIAETSRNLQTYLNSLVYRVAEAP